MTTNDTDMKQDPTQSEPLRDQLPDWSTLSNGNSWGSGGVDMITVHIYRWFSVIFIIAGTICNLISAMVYSKKKMRQTSYSVYLLILAIADLSVTWVGNLRFIVMSFYQSNAASDSSYWTGMDLRETSMAACKLHRFLTYFLLQFSSCLLCMLSVDRFFGCVLVLKSSTWCKPSVAKRIILITLSTLFLINIHFFIGMGYYERVEADTDTAEATNSSNHLHHLRLVCEPNPLNEAYMTFWNIYQWIDSAIYAIVPFFIMVFCNVLIINKIIRSRIRSKQVVIANLRINPFTRKPRRKLSTVLLPNEKRLSIILVLISFSFILLTMPASVVDIFPEAFAHVVSNNSSVMALAYMLMYLNHVINFFFYCSFGPRFRKEVKKLFPFKILASNKIAPLVSSKNYTIYGLSRFYKPVHRHDRSSVVSGLRKMPTYPFSCNESMSFPHIFLEQLNPFITLKENISHYSKSDV